MKVLGLMIAAVILSLGMMTSFSSSSSDNLRLSSARKMNLYNIYAPSLVEIKSEPEIEYTLEVLDEGEVMYSPGNGSGYRYGPSILKNEDGSIDVWFSSPGNGRQWDYIRYRHSDDGEHYTSEQIVLKPTENSDDRYSVCDPGAIFFNNYYYLGYTSTSTSKNGGVNNSAFVARSKYPDGPFEKWNGKGWGGKPKPIIEYDGNPNNWGAGELSFVIKDETLYIYYSWIDNEYLTKVAVSDLSENWPANIEQIDTVIVHDNGQDSVDVVYADDLDMFFGFAVESRFNADSGISIYKSKDGIEFEQMDTITDIHPYAHNMGISKDLNGHINSEEEQILGYAYARGSGKYYWGKWYTMFNKVILQNKE